MTIRQPEDRTVRVHGRFIQDARRGFFGATSPMIGWGQNVPWCTFQCSTQWSKVKILGGPNWWPNKQLGEVIFHSKTFRDQSFPEFSPLKAGLKPWRPTTPMAAEGGGALRQGGQRFLPEIHRPDARSIDTCRGSNRRRSFRRRRLMQIGWSLR